MGVGEGGSVCRPFGTIAATKQISTRPWAVLVDISSPLVQLCLV